MSSYNTTTNYLKEEKEDDCFPFNKPDKMNNETKKYENKLFIPEKLNKDKKRKEKLDNTAKRIKVKFFQKIKKIINNKLLKANSKFFFESFPQNFIANITKKINSEALQKKYGELFEYSYNISEIQNKAIEKKRKKNENTLNYLNSENNINICNESGWNKIKEMKYNELFNKFLISKEFEDSIKELEKTEEESYIFQYITLAKNFIDYFKEKTTLNNSDNNNNKKINTNITPIKEKEIEIVIENISKPKEPEIKEENDGIFFTEKEKVPEEILMEEDLNNDNDDYKIDDDNDDKLFISSEINEDLIMKDINCSFNSDIDERLYFIKSN